MKGFCFAGRITCKEQNQHDKIGGSTMKKKLTKPFQQITKKDFCKILKNKLQNIKLFFYQTTAKAFYIRN